MNHHLSENPYGMPGPRKRSYDGYNRHQEALWQIYDDCFFARINGYQDMRQPDPDFRIDPEIYDRWIERFDERQRFEAHRDKATRPLLASEFQNNLKLHMYERMVDAAKYREQVSDNGYPAVGPDQKPCQ